MEGHLGYILVLAISCFLTFYHTENILSAIIVFSFKYHQLLPSTLLDDIFLDKELMPFSHD